MRHSPSFCKGSFLIKLLDVSEGISKEWLHADFQKLFFKMWDAIGIKKKKGGGGGNLLLWGRATEVSWASWQESKSRILSSWLEGKEGFSRFMGAVLHFPSWLVVWKGNEVKMVEVVALAGDTIALFLINKKGHEELQRIKWLTWMGHHSDQIWCW